MDTSSSDSSDALPVQLEFAVHEKRAPEQTRPVSRRGPLAKAEAKWRVATREFGQIFGLASSWPERIGLAQFMAKLYAVRALPWGSYDWDVSVRLYGSVYTVGLRTSEIYVLEEVFRYRLYDRLSDYVPRADWTVFDVGANVGIVSLLAAQRGARVYAFEPNPDCHRRLLKNVRSNRLDNRVHPFNLAVSDKVGCGWIQVHKGGTTGGVLLKAERGKSAGRSCVDVTTLDRIVSMLSVRSIDLLKIDVEGAEVDVLRGGSKALEMTQRIIVECHSRELLRLVRETLIRSGFVCEQSVPYSPEEPGSGEPEVVILYAARPSGSEQGQLPVAS